MQSDLSDYIKAIKGNDLVKLPQNYETVLNVLQDEMYEESQQKKKSGGINLSTDDTNKTWKEQIDDKLKSKFYNVIGKNESSTEESLIINQYEKQQKENNEKMGEEQGEKVYSEKYLKGVARIIQLDEELAMKELELRTVRQNLIANRIQNNESMESIDDLRDKLFMTDVRASTQSLTGAKSNKTIPEEQSQNNSKTGWNKTGTTNSKRASVGNRKPPTTSNMTNRKSATTSKNGLAPMTQSSKALPEPKTGNFIKKNQAEVYLSEHEKFINQMSEKEYERYVEFMVEIEENDENREQIHQNLEDNFDSVYGVPENVKEKFALVDQKLEGININNTTQISNPGTSNNMVQERM